MSDLPVTAWLRGYGAIDAVQPANRVPNEFAGRLPSDTVAAGEVTAGVRLEFVGTASVVRLGVRVGGPAARSSPAMANACSVWTAGHWADQVALPVGGGEMTIALPARDPDQVVTVYLPEPTRVQVESVGWADGELRPAPRRPRWVVYGDSIAQGWCASDPGRTWPEIVARDLGLEGVNLGFAGAARGELPAAAHVAATPADVITLAWGTNCWSTIPFDEDLMGSTCRLFLKTVRLGQPDTDVLVVSPIVRPAAEDVPNLVGATLAGLRAALEDAVATAQKDDPRLHLVPGRHLVDENLLVDGIHPGDAGHQVLAAAVAAEIAELMRSTYT